MDGLNAILSSSAGATADVPARRPRWRARVC